MNKHIVKTTLSALTAAMLLSFPMNALSYTGLGEINSFRRDTVGNGLTYSEYKSTDPDGKAQSFYTFEYDPKGGVLPLVSYGSTVYGKDRLGTLVSNAWSGKKPVLGAINGDFYSMQTGVPLGVMIQDGKLISTDDSKYAIGFTADGKALIGKPSVKLTLRNVTQGGSAVAVDQLNKFPTVWGVYMLTDEFASTTMSASESLEIVIRLDGDIKAGGSITGYVKDIIDNDCNTAIPEGCAVLTVANTYKDYPLFTGIHIGDTLRIEAACDPAWNNVVTAVGGGDLILENGVMPDGIVDEDHEKISNPRTAVGIKADGTVLFFAADGRTSSGRGLTETELAAAMSEMDCVSALNLDGGGSTTVMVKSSAATECVYVNAPSDGGYRSLANAILLVSRETSDGIAAALSAVPNTPFVLSGSTVNFSAQAVDRAYMPIGGLIPSEELSLAYNPDSVYAGDVGKIADAGFTAGTIPGEYRLRLSYKKDTKLTGDVSVNVTDKIDTLEVTPAYTKQLTTDIVRLDVRATRDGRTVLCDSGSFYYTLNGTHVVADQKDYPGAMLICDQGILDTDGNFHTFPNVSGTVEIGVWYNEFVRYSVINISTDPDSVVNFDSSADLAKVSVSTGDAVSNVTLAASGSGFKSSGSFEVSYDFANEKFSRLIDLKLRDSFSVSPKAQSIKLWVSGDISGSMTAAVADESGAVYDLNYTVTKDYSRQLGWRELTAVIPESLKLGEMKLVTLLSVNDLGSGKRTIRIDNVSVDYGAEPKSPLADISGHWAEDYILRLYDMGVIEDSDCTKDGDSLTFAPDSALTRGEFAKMLTLWLGLDSSAYAADGVALEPDTPSDKLAYIRTAIAHGLMNGYGDENGVTVFKAASTITREEALKVIGSLLKSAEPQLTFTDAAQISGWAVSGVAKCVGAGAVRGYSDNTIRPSATISRSELCSILYRLVV